VREGDFAWVRPVTAADQSGMADGVVRRAEGSVLNQGEAGGKGIRDGIDAGDIQ